MWRKSCLQQRFDLSNLIARSYQKGNVPEYTTANVLPSRSNYYRLTTNITGETSHTIERIGIRKILRVIMSIGNVHVVLVYTIANKYYNSLQITNTDRSHRALREHFTM